MPTAPSSLQWRWGLAAAFAMLLLVLGAQFLPWKVMGKEWAGSYFSYHSDEAPYAAYVQALIEGRPRRNDPYSGRNDKPGSPQPESLFSIQFAPAYLVALPTRVLGISAQSAFIGLNCLLAIAAVLALYWLIAAVTGEENLAATGALIILCCGSLGRSPVIVRLFGSASGAALYLPFLRSYLPAVPFPFFFTFCGLVWIALTTGDRKKALVEGVCAGLVMAFLVFSYFYLWTAAAAWLVIVTLLWLSARFQPSGHNLKYPGLTALITLLALVPYGRLLARRAATTDAVQALTHSHRPDLLRPSELLGLVVIALIFFAAKRGLLAWREPRVLFTVSLALTPLVVFNQQVLTGYSLQPVHYEQYVTNYISLLSAVLAAAFLFQDLIAERRAAVNRVLACLALLALGYGAVEMYLGARALGEVNRLRDDVRPAALRLAELNAASSHAPPTLNAVVMATNVVQADNLPLDAPEAVLWSPHMRSFAEVTLAEDKERYYKLLYYSGIDESRFADLLRRSLIASSSIFGWERLNPHLSAEPKPISDEEIAAEVRRYAEFIGAFDQQRAAQPRISYVITPVNGEPDLANLDRWYVRERGERVGNAILYRVSLR